jgi:hypothetical protein
MLNPVSSISRAALRIVAGLLVLGLGLPLLAGPDEGRPAQKSSASQFIRIKRGSRDAPQALETATMRYIPASGEGKLVVDLIGAVHIGDHTYYDKLNEQFEQYDVLLYELVAPKGARIPKGGRRDVNNPIALLQQIGKSVLDLESQVEQIDYTKKNFVHADLSPEGMAQAMRRRGEDGVTLLLDVLADMLRQQNIQEQTQEEQSDAETSQVDFFSLLLDPDGAVKMKQLLAEQMVSVNSPTGGLGKTLNTILVSDRNEAAMKVFQAELAKGKKKIGIFYGVAHMPDFEKRLREDFGLKRQSEGWTVAWDLRGKKSGLGQLFRRLAP